MKFSHTNKDEAHKISKMIEFVKCASFVLYVKMEEKLSKKSITKNYIYNMIYQALTLVLPIITTPYLSRVLGAEGIGIYGYTYSVVTYFILFGSLGVALYGQREIAYAGENKEKRNKIFIEVNIFRFITIAIATIVYGLIFMRRNIYQVYYRILLFELWAAAFDISWFFQGMEEFKKTVVRNVLVRLSSVALVFLLVKTREDLVKFVLIYSLADFIGNLSLWLYLPKYTKDVKVKNIDIWKHVVPIFMLFIPQIANQVYKILDTTMIGKLVIEKSETGYYEQSQKVIRLLLTIVTSLGVVMVPRMASTFASGDRKKVNEYMKLSFKFVFFLAFPLMFGIVSVSSSFVPVFFGRGYDKVIQLINIMSPILVLMGVANVVGVQYLLPTKKQKEYTVSVTIGVISNFFLNYYLIKRYEAIGAAIATVLSQLIVDVIQLLYIKNDIDVKEIIMLAKKYLLSSLVMYIFCFMTGRYVKSFNGGYIWSIISQVMVGIIVYFTMLIILKDDYIYKFINTIKSKIVK